MSCSLALPCLSLPVLALPYSLLIPFSVPSSLTKPSSGCMSLLSFSLTLLLPASFLPIPPSHSCSTTLLFILPSLSPAPFAFSLCPISFFPTCLLQTLGQTGPKSGHGLTSFQRPGWWQQGQQAVTGPGLTGSPSPRGRLAATPS